MAEPEGEGGYSGRQRWGPTSNPTRSQGGRLASAAFDRLKPTGSPVATLSYSVTLPDLGHCTCLRQLKTIQQSVPLASQNRDRRIRFN